MATLESTQIRVLVDSVQDTDEPHTCNEDGEQTLLLGTIHRRYGFKSKFSRSCCIKSKAALSILFWNALISILVGFYLEFGSIFATDKNLLYLPYYTQGLQIYAPFWFGFLAILYLFYPLAGCLADIKCGRHKAVVYSLWFIVWGGAFTIIGTITIACYTNRIIPLKKVSMHVLLAIGFGPPTVIGIFMLSSSYISFSANVIQFGMDQLHDSPSEDSVLFIHWFVFTLHLGLAINKFVILTIDLFYQYTAYHTNYSPGFVVVLNTTSTVALTLLGISAWIIKCKHHWFMIDTGSRNPYKLVYKVIKFATQHKTPIRRSAFTYCEDELPSRMDLGKEKYGGPFTTEQVEDVKAFLGILQVLVTLGPVFTTDIAASNMLYKFSNHLNISLYEETLQEKPFLSLLFTDFTTGELTDILIVFLIPIYLCLLRPFIHHYIPGMLKRIGLGMIIHLLSLLSVFLIDTIGHTLHSNNQCFIQKTLYDDLDISVHYLTFPYTLNALSIIFFYTATYEFMCAQSPHAMKGLLIGTFFLIKGLFQFLGITVVLIPFFSWNFNTSFPSCGFVYYLVNILVALIGLVAYTWVARRYQYRQRDEPDNIYRYAEEYYDRDQDEPYDYSNDCDNLNVHTVN